MGGGGVLMEPANPRLDAFVLSLARSANPRVCFVPTATGDAEQSIQRFRDGYAGLPCRTSVLRLFGREVADLEAFVLAHDVVYVGGGNTANLLAVWRVHGLDVVLRRAWEEGIVLCGLSAGMNCWFAESVTDSFNLAQLEPLHDGLGFLSGSACPHYDGEPQRRPAYRRFVAEGRLAAGFAADDGAALVFAGGELSDVVSSRSGVSAYRLEPGPDGEIRETRLAARYLDP